MEQSRCASLLLTYALHLMRPVVTERIGSNHATLGNQKKTFNEVFC